MWTSAACSSVLGLVYKLVILPKKVIRSINRGNLGGPHGAKDAYTYKLSKAASIF